MRQILYIVGLLSLLACEKEAEIQESPALGKIEFATALAPTKAMAKTAFTIGDQFYVYGVATKDADYTPNTPNGNEHIFKTNTSKGVAVTNYGANPSGADVWKYDEATVWLPGKSTFFAFSPVPNHIEDYGITNHKNGFALTQAPSITFTVAGGYDPNTATPQEIADSRKYNKRQVDLLAASVFNQKAGSVTPIAFEHKLAHITFAVKPMQAVGFIRIISVTLKNVMTSANLSLDHKGWNETTLNRQRDFSINLNNAVVASIPVGSNVNYQVNDPDETLMMIPQPIANVVITVRYAYSIDGINWPDYEQGKELNVALTSISQSWSQASQYNYILAIDPSK